jgi:hypothetical protein
MRFVLFLSVFLLVSCASDSSSQHSSVNMADVKDSLVKGKTSQKDVMEKFGGPDLVDVSDQGETWVYTRHASESSDVNAGVSAFFDTARNWWQYSPVGGSIGGGNSKSSTKTSSLALNFNKKKILTSYNFRTERF